jgi:hypothetical protein
MAQIESHVAACDSCCEALASVPDDTLLQLAREAATHGFRTDEPRQKAAPEPPPDIPPELVNHPRYRVLGLVGVGGMGAVYKAEHRLMKRLVALKTISPAFLKHAAAVARFRNEFQSTARLSHPNGLRASARRSSTSSVDPMPIRGGPGSGIAKSSRPIEDTTARSAVRASAVPPPSAPRGTASAVNAATAAITPGGTRRGGGRLGAA